MKGKVTLNESQLRQIVLESVRKVLKEGSFEHGISFNDVDGKPGDVKGKNWFANHGIINLESNNESPVKVYVTTTFLGNHRLAGKLGAKWGTGSQKKVFNAFTVDSNAILVIVNFTDRGKVVQIQYTKDGPQMAYDGEDRQVKIRKDWFFNETVMNFFDTMLEKTREMCAEEDEFFNSKTSKSYDKFKNGYE